MCRIDLACLKEIARVSNLLNHQNQQRKNDDVKLTNVREDHLFFISHKLSANGDVDFFCSARDGKP
jgi:hypothetical protein